MFLKLPVGYFAFQARLPLQPSLMNIDTFTYLCIRGLLSQYYMNIKQK